MLVIFVFLIYIIDSKVASVKIDICTNLECDDVGEEVCGIRTEGEGFRLKMFPSECDLLKSGCAVKEENAYGVINMDYCIKAFKTDPDRQTSEIKDKTTYKEFDCSFPIDALQVCGIKKDGQGFRIRLFENKCQLWKYNYNNQLNFTMIDLDICNGMEVSEKADERSNNDNDDLKNNDSVEDLIILNNSTKNYENYSDDAASIDDNTTVKEADTVSDVRKNIVVVRSPLIDFNRINETIDNFFAATHVFDLPVREMERDILNETTRRRLIKVAGPIRVFVPRVIIPKNISEDSDHRPTLSSCFHKCPRKCPDTYAPVCGVPGIVAREPVLMFQNHCFMDVAQCKMHWEDKSPTALSSAYEENSFLFCLGDEMSGMYRFLPLIRTLQHMGRLKKKGRFHYRLHNMKFFNNHLSRQPKFMGK